MLVSTAAAALALAGSVAAAPPILNLAGSYESNIKVSVENVAQCKDATITWTGTEGDATLLIGTGGMYIGPIKEIQTFGPTSAGKQTWKVNRAAGSDHLIFQVTDSKGKIGYTQDISIQSSDDSSCLDGGGKGSQTPSQAPTSENKPEAPKTEEHKNDQQSQAQTSPAGQQPSTEQQQQPTSEEHKDAHPTSSDKPAEAAPAPSDKATPAPAPAPAPANNQDSTTNNNGNSQAVAQPPANASAKPTEGPAGGAASPSGTNKDAAAPNLATKSGDVVVTFSEAGKAVTKTFTGPTASAAAASAVASAAKANTSNSSGNGAGAVRPASVVVALAALVAAAVF